MDYSDILKVILFTPLLIAAGFAIMFLSYVMVPAMIVGSVGFVVYTAVRLAKEEGH